MKKKLLSVLIGGLMALGAFESIAQTVGDYRSFGVGTAWTTAANWELCAVNGVWPGVASATYPGQNAAVAGSTVTIRDTHTRNISGAIANSIVNLVVGEGASGSLSVATAMALTVTNLTLVTSGTPVNTDGNITISGILDFTGVGRILVVGSTGNVTLGSAATITNFGGSPSSYIQLDGGTGINGNLIKTSNGTTASWQITYPIGTSSGGYTPIVLGTVGGVAPTNGTSTISVKAIYNASNQGQLRRMFRLVVNNATATTFTGPIFNYNLASDVSVGDAISNYSLIWHLSSLVGTWGSVTGTNAGGGSFAVTTPSHNLVSGTYYYTLGSTTSYPSTWYTYQSGNWSNYLNWTLDPSGTTSVNPLSLPPGPGDQIVILNGFTITNDDEPIDRVISNTIINGGGILDMAATTGNTLGTVSGTGTLRINGVTPPALIPLPTGSYTSFVSTLGGTFEFYNTGGTLPAPTTYNNLKLSNTGGGAITFTTLNNLEVNGTFDIAVPNTFSGALPPNGTVKWQINDNTNTQRLITLKGKLKVASNGKIGVGTGTTGPHSLTMFGDIDNSGEIKFFDDQDLAFSDANYTSGAIYTTALKGNTVIVTYSGTPDNLIECKSGSKTDFYRLVLNKGTGQQANLEVNSNGIANFRLFGPTHLGASGTSPNQYSNNNLSIINGTLELTGTMTIPNLVSANGDYFPIPQTGALHLNGTLVTVVVTDDVLTNNDRQILLEGLLIMSDGILNCGASNGIVSGDGGAMIVDGGLIKAWQFRPKNPGTGTFAYSQSSGTFNVGHTYAASAGPGSPASQARFDLASPNSTFQMTGGFLNVARPTNNGSIIILSSSNNYSVTGGTVSVYTGPTTGSEVTSVINTTTPFYDFNVFRNGGTSIAQLSGNSLVVLNNMTINNTGGNGTTLPTFSTNNLNLTIGGNFDIQSTTTFTPGTGTVTFNNSGTSGTKLWTQNGTITALANLVINKPSSTLTLAGSGTFPSITGGTTGLTITAGTLDAGTKTLTVTGAISNSGIHGNGTITVTTATTIGGTDGTFDNLTITTNGTIATSGNQTITTNLALNGTTCILNIASYALSVGGTLTASPAFNTTHYIRTSSLHNAGGLTRKAAPTDLLFPLGTATLYTPNTITAAVSGSGSITVRNVNAEHPNVSSTPNLSLKYYWRVTSSIYAVTGAVNHKLYTFSTTTQSGASGINYVQARYDATNNTWSNNPVAYNAVGRTDIPNFSTGTDWAENTSAGDQLDGEYTCGLTTAFTNPLVYKSTTNNGTWVGSNWSNISHNPPPSGTCIITNGSPAVVTFTGHGLAAGNAIRFSTTGTLPTGITAGLIYYVISTGFTANDFQISATSGGSAINTSSNGSGTHTTNPTLAGPPCAACPVVIGDGVTYNHKIDLTANSQTCGILTINKGSTLDCSTFTGLDLGTNVAVGVAGAGTLRINSPQFPAGDFTNFIDDGGGTVEWYGIAKTIPSTGQAPQSLNLINYNNLIISPDAGVDITLPANNLTIYNDFTVSGLALNGRAKTNDAAVRTIAINGALHVKTGTFLLENNNATTFTLTGDGSRTGTITTAGTAVSGVGTLFLTELNVGQSIYTSGGVLIGVISTITTNTSLALANSALVAVTAAPYKISGGDITIGSAASMEVATNLAASHTITTSGNIINNGKIDLWGTSDSKVANLVFTGTNDVYLGGTNIGGADFSYFTVNKGASQTNKVTFNMSGTPTASNTTPWLFLTNGTFDFANSGTFTISTASVPFSIPTTGKLKVSSGAVNILNANNDGADLQLNGALEVAGSTFVTKTGTISSSTASTAVTGTSTLFTTQLVVGQSIFNSGGTLIGVVASITSNTSLALSSNAALTLTNLAYTSLGGTVSVGSSANPSANNDIEYASAGTPTIIVSGGSLYVNGAIRRSTASLTGALDYTQSGGTVTVGGADATANDTRGVFEIDYNGESNFAFTGGTLTVLKPTGGNTYADVYINPVNSSAASGATLVVGQNGAAQTLDVNIAPTLGSFTVQGGTSAQTVNMFSNPMVLLGDLTITSPSTLITNSLNVTIAGNLSITGTGTYTGGTNTTTFNGSASKTATLSATSTFSNMTLSKSVGTTLSLFGSAPDLTNLNILSGTLDVGSMILDVSGNIVNNSFQTGTGYINFALAATAHTLTCGDGITTSGSFTNISLGGTATTKTINVTGSTTILGILDFTALGTSRYFNIGSSKLTFGIPASLIPASISNAGSTRFIKTNGVSSDAGVVRTWPSGGNLNFTYAVGTRVNYTPVIFTGLDVTTGGDLTVIPVDDQHPTSDPNGTELLSYYWIMTNGSTFAYTNTAASVEFQAPTALIGGAVGTRTGNLTSTSGSNLVSGSGTLFLTELIVGQNIYTSAGLLIGKILSITNNTALILDANTTVTWTNLAYLGSVKEGTYLDVSGLNGSNGWEVTSLAAGTPPTSILTSGANTLFTINNTNDNLLTVLPSVNKRFDYTIGDPSALPYPIAFVYSRLTGNAATVGTSTVGGPWSDPNSWTLSSTGLGAPLSSVPTNKPVFILSGHRINMTANGHTSFTANIGGLLVVGITIAHNIGTIIGIGTLRTSTSTFPAGNYNAFVASTGGTIEYAATISMNNRNTYNNLTAYSGAGTVTMTNSDLTVNGNLTIDNGVTLSNSNNADITILKNWINNGGAFAAGFGSVTFSAITAAQTIGGSGSTSFYGLTLNNTFGTMPQITMSSNPIATNALTMTSGVVNLAGTSFTLGSSVAASTLSRSGSTWMYGGAFCRFWPVAAVSSSDVNSYGLYPIGASTASSYRPVEINSSSIPTVTGSFCVTHNEATTNINLSPVYSDAGTNIVRKHNAQFLTTSTATGGTYDIGVTMTGLPTGPPDNTGDMRLAVSDGALTVTTVGTHVSATGSASNPTVRRSGVSLLNLAGKDFRVSTINIADTPLPIELLSFTGRLKPEGVELNWKTATETENDFFTIEKSAAGEDFSPIGKVPGAGTSVELRQYQFIDPKPFLGISYYRLKQTDFNGKFEYSKVISIDYNGSEHVAISVYPNPTNGHEVTIEISGLRDISSLPISIFDQVGRQYLSSNLEVDASTGTAVKKLSTEGMADGVYVLKVGSSFYHVKRLIITK